MSPLCWVRVIIPRRKSSFRPHCRSSWPRLVAARRNDRAELQQISKKNNKQQTPTTFNTNNNALTLHTYVCVYASAPMYAEIYPSIDTYIYLCIWSMCTYVYVRVCVRVCVCVGARMRHQSVSQSVRKRCGSCCNTGHTHTLGYVVVDGESTRGTACARAHSHAHLDENEDEDDDDDGGGRGGARAGDIYQYYYFYIA